MKSKFLLNQLQKKLFSSTSRQFKTYFQVKPSKTLYKGIVSYKFSTKEEVIDVDSTPEVAFKESNKEKLSFKAETKKLLDIVTHSLYTDKEIFLRELLSNCSDALEKQRYLENSGKLTITGDPLHITITSNEKDKTLTIFDSGVGMSREELIDNLGTIAKSGTQSFLKEMKKENSTNESLIGQFGVGFYSSFIVGDLVEVISKKQTESKGSHWVSDGSGDFQVSDIENPDFSRGTKIIIHLKPECRDFSKGHELIKIAKKHSNFISYSIKVNGEKINDIQAIWYREKKEISNEEYQRFYESLNKGSKLAYKYLIHFSTDTPRDIKTILFVPSQSGEKFGMTEDVNGISLYSKKVLIKPNCSELLPRYLRFVKGVIDCSDIPLSISRESYQDSSIIQKLRIILTKRILKKLEDELKQDSKTYDQWYEEFHMFLKEGLISQEDDTEQLFRLQRFKLNLTGPSQKITIEEYIQKMLKNQNKIYFLIVSNEKFDFESNVFLEQFQGTDLPILLSNQPVDEMIFKKINHYKDFKFVNVENESDDFLEKLREDKGQLVNKLPEEDISAYSLWLKNELEPYVGKVTLSKRLQSTPMLVSSEMSSNMKGFMAMMNQNVDPTLLLRDLHLEINPSHELIIKLNELRKEDNSTASLSLKLIFDAAVTQSNLALPPKETVKRTFNLVGQFINLKLNDKTVNNSEVKLERMTDKFEDLKKE